MPAKVYTDKDADLAHLQKRRCAVLGFGSQGHAHALNLKDSGVEVLVGLYPESKSIPVAKDKGFDVRPVAEAVEAADVILFATPDLKIRTIYEKEVAPKLADGKTLLFSHGFAVHFETIQVPPDRIWFEELDKLKRWQELKKSGDAKALDTFQEEALGERDAWQFGGKLVPFRVADAIVEQYQAGIMVPNPELTFCLIARRQRGTKTCGGGVSITDKGDQSAFTQRHAA